MFAYKPRDAVVQSWKGDKYFNLYADLSKTLFNKFGTPADNESFRQVLNFEKYCFWFEHYNTLGLLKSMTFLFSFRYQKFKFKSTQNTPPPTPLRIAECFCRVCERRRWFNSCFWWRNWSRTRHSSHAGLALTWTPPLRVWFLFLIYPCAVTAF